MMDLFPSLSSMLDLDLSTDPLCSDNFDFSISYENNYGLVGGSDLLSEIFNDEKSFSSHRTEISSSSGGHQSQHRAQHNSQLSSPIFQTLTSKQKANRANMQARRNRIKMKAKLPQHQQQQQQQFNQQRQYSSLLSSSSTNNSQIARSLIQNAHNTASSSSSNGTKATVSASVSARNGTASQKPAMPRVYVMQTSPSKKVKSVLSPAKQLSTVAPSVGVFASQKELPPAASMGISLLVKAPEKKKSLKKLAREQARRKRQFYDALLDHDYDTEIQKSLDAIHKEHIERLKRLENELKEKQAADENRKTAAVAQATNEKVATLAQEKPKTESVIESDIASEQQRLTNDLEDIANGFIPDDVILNELPNCLKDLFDGFGDSTLRENGTEAILDGLNDTCNLMQNQFIDELFSSGDIQDLNFTDDELNQMIGLIGDFDSPKDEVEDSAVESASDGQNVNTDKSEPSSVATSECDEESDYFGGATIAMALNSTIKRNRKASGSSTTRRKRRYSARSFVSDSDSNVSSIEPDSESNSSRPSSPDSTSSYGSKVQHKKHPNKKNKSHDGKVNENVLFIGNIPSGFKKSDLRSWFGKFGTIQNIRVFANSALITFESASQTRNAIKYGNDDIHHPTFSLSFGRERQSPSRQKYIGIDMFEEDTIDFRISGNSLDYFGFES